MAQLVATVRRLYVYTAILVVLSIVGVAYTLTSNRSTLAEALRQNAYETAEELPPQASPLLGFVFALVVLGVVLAFVEGMRLTLSAPSRDVERSAQLAIVAIDSARNLVPCQHGLPASIEEWEERTAEAKSLLDYAHSSAGSLAILGRNQRIRNNADDLKESLQRLGVAVEAPSILVRAGVRCPTAGVEADEYWRRRREQIEKAISTAERSLQNLT